MHCAPRRRIILPDAAGILICGALALPIPAAAKSGSQVTSSGTNKPPATTTATTAKDKNKVHIPVGRKAGHTQMEY